MKRLLLMAVATLALTACEYTEVERETGYKGRARANPWLAAERFVERLGWKTRPVISWTAPTGEDAVWMLPASVLSNESFTRRMEPWVCGGGHLILLVECADAETSDWSKHHAAPVLGAALTAMLQRAGIDLDKDATQGSETSVDEIEFGGETFEVDAKYHIPVAFTEGEAGVFASSAKDSGRITVLADARLFRNRWIGDKDHAALLQALIESTGRKGMIGFMRGAGLSLWGMSREYLWPVLWGLGVCAGLWLWKNLVRFGPVESAAVPPVLRGYEHHLEALGDFQWRHDRAAALLAPLRTRIIELGQHAAARAGRTDEDSCQFLADRAGLPRERVRRALAEEDPADPAMLTRITADLQQMLEVLHNPILP